MRSATDVSGVASFSAKRSSLWIHRRGVASPSKATRLVVDLASLDRRGPIVEKLYEVPDEARLCLATLAEHDEVVRGDDAPFESREDGFPIADYRREERLLPAELAEQVGAHLLLDRPVGIAGGLELAQGSGTLHRVSLRAVER
jgi:hypothetical protein